MMVWPKGPAAQVSSDVRPHEQRMELFGIALSVPLAFAASVVYCAILVKVIHQHQRAARWLWWASAGIISCIVLEVVLLVTIGAVHSQRIVGSLFYTVHLALFFLGPPALANVMLLRQRTAPFRWSCAAVVLFTLLALGLVLLQYSVSEALYGINGGDGPSSAISAPFSIETTGASVVPAWPMTSVVMLASEGVRSNKELNLTVTPLACASVAPAGSFSVRSGR